MTLNTLKAMDTVSVCIELECGDLLEEIDNVDKASVVLSKVKCLRHSQGFYTRLCGNLEQYINNNGAVTDIERIYKNGNKPK